MHKVVWTQEAEQDLESILGYYLAEAGRSGAESIYLRIREQVGSRRLFPERCRPGRVGGTREHVTQRLPYIVVVEVTPGLVPVVAVVHTARKYP